jgi:hypothetical protein
MHQNTAPRLRDCNVAIVATAAIAEACILIFHHKFTIPHNTAINKNDDASASTEAGALYTERIIAATIIEIPPNKKASLRSWRCDISGSLSRPCANLISYRITTGIDLNAHRNQYPFGTCGKAFRDIEGSNQIAGEHGKQW